MSRMRWALAVGWAWAWAWTWAWVSGVEGRPLEARRDGFGVGFDVGRGLPGWPAASAAPETGYLSPKGGAHDDHLFYWYYAAQEGAKDGNGTADGETPVVLWLTGGPGCSSAIAMFYENGPVAFGADGQMAANPHGWNARAHLVFVDQPVGTGFSYTHDARDVVTNEDEVGRVMYGFLEAFFDAHPELREAPLYVTGESYAGHYVPAITYKIWRETKGQGPPGKRSMNLQGMAIGNGLTDPGVQYAAYADFAEAEGLISHDVAAAMRAAYPACKALIDACAVSDKACVAAVVECQATAFAPILAGNPGINVYDVRENPCPGSHPLCYDFTAMEGYMARPDVRQSLGVPDDVQFESCSAGVHAALTTDWMKNLEVHIPELLDSGDVRVLIYAGDKDLICNWLGNERWTRAMRWGGRAGFNAAPVAKWTLENPHDGTSVDAGEFRAFGALTFLKVYNAGHMVPMDQPGVALAMLDDFIRV